MKNKTLAALAYIFWVPSLYIVLTEMRREEYVGFHGGQALLLWTWIFVVFFLLRFLVNLVWRFYYVPYLDVLEILFGFCAWGYAFYCALRLSRDQR